MIITDCAAITAVYRQPKEIKIPCKVLSHYRVKPSYGKSFKISQEQLNELPARFKSRVNYGD